MQLSYDPNRQQEGTAQAQSASTPAPVDQRQAMDDRPARRRQSAQRRRRAEFRDQVGFFPARKRRHADQEQHRQPSAARRPRRSRAAQPTVLPPPKRIDEQRIERAEQHRVAQATTSNTLLVSKSRFTRHQAEKRPPSPTFGARQAKRASEEPMTVDQEDQDEDAARRGSVAKACTEVSTPERTRKVPSKDSENAESAKRTVQFLKLPRFLGGGK